MRRQLRLPAVLSVAMLGGTVGAVAVSCGDDGGPTPDAQRADATSDAVPCVAYCFPDGTGTGNECPFPTCATGPAFDQCPEHCDVGI